MTPSVNDVHHLGRLQRKGRVRYVILLAREDGFAWFEQADGEWSESVVCGETVAQAVQEALKTWKYDAFRPVNCGYRYMLPERDEHGQPALFEEMVASYSSFNGVAFSQEEGYNYFVDFASHEAKEFWATLQA